MTELESLAGLHTPAGRILKVHRVLARARGVLLIEANRRGTLFDRMEATATMVPV